MKKLFQPSILTVLGLFLAATLMTVVVYPEVFIGFKSAFMLWSDYCIEYPLSFVLTGFFYQGGLQLWNFFGQMPYFHTYTVEGLFKLPNMITAITYCLMRPFSGDEARLFHHVFTWANFFTLLFLRVAGVFLLLRTVTKDRVMLSVGTVIFAVFFSQLAFLRGTFYMSCFPLGMYFVVRFFHDLQWRYLIASFLFIIVCLGSGILHGAYLYLPMHFFILSGILWRVFCCRQSSPPFAGLLKQPFPWKQAAWAIGAAVFILLPYAYIVKFGFPDLAFDQGNSRISHPFSPQWYFHNPELDLGGPRSFFSMILNMQSFDMYYVGISFIFVAMAGLVFSRHALKWFFAIGIISLWLLNFPREGINIGLLAHWINVLTNPLKTIPRSYTYACQPMIPYLLMPLAVMGIESLTELYKGKKFSRSPLICWGSLMLVFVFNGVPSLPIEAAVYLTLAAVMMTAGLGWLYFKDSAAARKFLVGALCVLFIIDIFFIIYQTKNRFVHQYTIKPLVFDVSPQAGMLSYDFQNPSIFPFRYTYTLHFSFRDQTVLWSPHGIASDMYHVVNQGLNYVYLNGYTPRDAELAKWFNDPPMLHYLSQNEQFMFLAPTAIKASPDGLNRIASAGLAQQVVEIADPSNALNLPDQWPAGTMAKPAEGIQYAQLFSTLDDSDQSEYHGQGDMVIYTLHLPTSFPAHLASSWFLPEERYLRFLIETKEGQWQELQAAQGELIRPYTFDVQNIKQGQLKAAFPEDAFLMHHRCVVLYPSADNQGVESLWRKQFDNLGFMYKAKSDGWLMAHYPYDKKWQIFVDGKKTAYYRADQSFIAFPLSQGEHKILIRYWPDSPLRILLLISALLTASGLPLLILLALKWEKPLHLPEV